MADQFIIKGTKQEQKRFTEVIRHNEMAENDLNSRKKDFDTVDELFRSHIKSSGWPYNAEVFDPRTFTAIFEKTSRLLANKPRGRMVPREGGDALGARINNELLGFQWDEVSRLDGWPMLARWALMDMNTRKYGASFALVKWHYETRVARNKDEEDKKAKKGKKGKRKLFFDGPTFRPWLNRDVLHNPSYSTVRKWIQLRDYNTIKELQNINDAARGKPIYKNLDILRDAVKKEAKSGGDSRASNWASRNKSIKGLEDFLGKDELFKTVEVVTEYRDDRWIVFAPKHGVIVRDIPNPYLHGQIPVVMMKYYPIDDDIYGLSEIEPVEKLQKAINALVCQYLDAINMSLYVPLKVRTTAVQMHTLEFGPGRKWLMNDPGSDVIPHEVSGKGISEFTATYRFLVGAMQEALGETSAAISNLVPGESGKTATEIRDLAIQRNARDGFNQLFLSEAIKRQMMLWHSMNKQFYFDKDEQAKVIRIVGKEAIRFFQQRGLDGLGLTGEAIEQITSPEMEGTDFEPEQFQTPLFPVNMGEKVGQVEKFIVEEGGEVGNLILEPEDLSGNYDYIPDVESMRIPDDAQLLATKKQMLEIALRPENQQALAASGYRLKIKELEEDFFEQLGLKDAEKYFEKLQPVEEANVQAQQAGAGGLTPGGGTPGNVPPQGVGPGPAPVAGGQAQPVVS